MPKSPRSLIAAVVFTLAFVINPAYVAGCGDEDAEPNFGEAQMLELLDGLNAMGPYTLDDGEGQYEVELMLTQAGGEDDLGAALRSLFASRAYACGSRTFMQSAAACITVTWLPFEGALMVRRVEGDEPVVVVSEVEVSGTIEVFGEQLRSARVELDFVGGDATWNSDDGARFSVERFVGRNLGEAAIDIAVTPAPAARPAQPDPYY